MEGIVINAIDYKEKSKIVYLYTPNGLISVKALDVKTKLPFITSLNVLEFEITNSNFPRVTEYSLKKSYYDFNANFSRLNTAYIIISIIKNIGDNSNHNRIYNFLIECFDLLKNNCNHLFVLSLFLVKMLFVFGVKPNIESCVKCGKLKIVDFDVYSGGALCECCSNYNEKNYKLYLAIKRLYNAKVYNDEDYNDIDYEFLLDSLYNYYLIHVNLKLNSYKFK